MDIRDIPGWLTCPPAQSSSSVWSMAVTQAEAARARVLAMSIQVRHKPGTSLKWY